MKDKKTALGYNLFVDEDLSDALTMFMCLFVAEVEKGGDVVRDPDFFRWLGAIHKMEDFRVKAVHDLNWCKDPNCQYHNDHEQ